MYCNYFSECLRKCSLEQSTDFQKKLIFILRLIVLILLVILLIIHMKSVRVFKWEQSVSGGVYVTYVLGVAALVLCAGINRCGGQLLQAYICATGAVLLFINSTVMWERLHHASPITLAVAELLASLGLPLRRQILSKIWLSAVVAMYLALDLVLVPIFAYYKV